MRIPSGKTDQLIYFVALDVNNQAVRKTALTTFTVYRSRNGGAATAYTTPTVAELDAVNMPGVYSLAIDEDTTIASGSDAEEYVVHITQASMAPVTRAIELFRRDTTTGKTITVDSAGLADANTVKVGPTGSGTAQTAGDIPARLPLALTANGNIKASLVEILTTALTETSGQIAAAFKKFFDKATPTGTINSLPDAVPDASGGLPVTGNRLTAIPTLPAALVGGRIDASVGAVASGVIAAASFASGALDAVWSTATRVLTAATNLTTALATPTNITAGTITTVTTVTNLSATAIQAIWDALTSALTTVGSIGKWIVDKLDVVVSTRTKPADTQARVTLVDTTTTLTNAPSDSSGVTTLLSRLSALRAGYLDNLSAGAVALEASLQGLITTVGVAGAGLTAADDAVIAAIAALNNLSLANVRTAVGLASANLDTQLAAIAVYIDTEVAAILAKVNNLPSDPADASDIAALFSAIAASLAALSIPTTAQIADKLLGRNLAGGSDGVRTVQDALRFSRNKVTIVPINATSGTLTVYAEDDTTPAWTGVVTRASADALSAVDPA